MMETVWLLKTLEEKLANYVCGSCLSGVKNEFYIWDASHFPVPPAQLPRRDEMPPASSICRKRLRWSHVWNVPSFLPPAMAMSPRQCQHTGDNGASLSCLKIPCGGGQGLSQMSITV